MINDKRTLADLAKEVLDIQSACNLSGLIHSWSRSISRLRVLLNEVQPFNTTMLNEHPINKLWADKVSSLVQSPNTIGEYGEVIEAVDKLIKGC